jgi:23S rRNA (uracil1939-C5)-methyltransferase
MSDETFKLELTTMAHGGSALGRHEKQTIFVPYTIPGEIVEARILRDKGRIAFAEGLKLVAASGDRVFPRCPHFGPHRCGSCHWQHIDYNAQLLLKQDVLADQLARIGNFDDVDIKPVIPSPQQWQMNHQMTFVPNQHGKLCFPGADGKTPMPIEECHLLHPDLLALIDTLTLEFTGLRSIKLQIGTDGAHMLVLSVDSEDDAPELATDLTTSVNLLLPDNVPVNLIGDAHSTYAIAGRDFRVTAGSWFRANVAQLEQLISLVIELLAVDENAAVLDLYAGVGLFSAALAPNVSLVTLVESYPPSATDADKNLADFDNVDVIEGTAEEVLGTLSELYEAAVLDPPSSGLSVEMIDALAKAKIPRLVYVSRDPATLARDAKRLVKDGYTLSAVHPIDFSPQTYYIDCVAVLERYSRSHR